MSKELIEKIMTEVKDEETRDKLLKAVADESNAKNNDSTIMNELEKMGINTGAAKKFTKSTMIILIITGYLVGGLFFIGGSLVMLVMAKNQQYGNAFFASICAAMGCLSIYRTIKLSRVLK